MISRAARLAQVAIGVWLIVAPAALDYGSAAETNDRIVGPVAVGFAFVAVWAVLASLRWAVVPLAVWLVLAPLVLWYETPAAIVNSVSCGLSLGALSFVSSPTSETFGGGWPTLWTTLPDRIGPGAPGTRDDLVAER